MLIEKGCYDKTLPDSVRLIKVKLELGQRDSKVINKIKKDIFTQYSLALHSSLLVFKYA